MQLLFSGTGYCGGGNAAEMQGEAVPERVRSPLEMYQDFYEEVRGKEMDEERLQVVEQIIKDVEAEG